jgi:hypothetical protein
MQNKPATPIDPKRLAALENAIEFCKNHTRVKPLYRGDKIETAEIHSYYGPRSPRFAARFIHNIYDFALDAKFDIKLRSFSVFGSMDRAFAESFGGVACFIVPTVKKYGCFWSDKIKDLSKFSKEPQNEFYRECVERAFKAADMAEFATSDYLDHFKIGLNDEYDDRFKNTDPAKRVVFFYTYAKSVVDTYAKTDFDDLHEQNEILVSPRHYLSIPLGEVQGAATYEDLIPLIERLYTRTDMPVRTDTAE